MITIPLFALFGAFLVDEPGSLAWQGKVTRDRRRIQAGIGDWPPPYANPVIIKLEDYDSLKLAQGLLVKFQRRTKELQALLVHPDVSDAAKEQASKIIVTSQEQEKLAAELVMSLRHTALNPAPPPL